MRLGNQEVHIYSITLSANPEELKSWQGLLNHEERERAARFVTPILRERFIVAHGALRKILSNYLNIDPKEIEFSVNAYQKPQLAEGHGSSLQFNLSHSDNQAVFAIARDHAIGIDIEKIRADQNLDLAERFFSTEEINALRKLAADQQLQAFFTIWARKEAIIKATGKGLAQPLRSFTVACHNIEEQVQVDGQTWNLTPLELHPDYTAAFAADAPLTIKLIQI